MSDLVNTPPGDRLRCRAASDYRATEYAAGVLTVYSVNRSL
jgi:hypothetical protein